MKNFNQKKVNSFAKNFNPKDLENKITVLSASVECLETQKIQALEEENRSLMQRLGIRK